MIKGVSAILAMVICLIPFDTYAGKSSENIEKSVYQWLLQHQSTMTGIVGNQERDNFSGIYSNALAAMSYIHEGDLDEAKRIFDFFDQRFDQEFEKGTPQGFHQFWNANSGDVYADTDRWIGDNAWLLVALNYYRQITQSTNYDKMRKGIAEWLIGLQDKDGGIRSGFTKNGPMKWKSTEGNLDTYAALIDYPEERQKIKNFLVNKMWVERDKRFRMGTTVRQSGLDCIAWAIGALGVEYKNTLAYAEKKFIRTVRTDISRKKVTGFSDFVDKDRVWYEGTSQMAVAYNIVGKKRKAKKYIAQIEKVLQESDVFAETFGVPCSANIPAWEGASRMIFVPSQTWYLFAKWGFNPLNTSEKME